LGYYEIEIVELSGNARNKLFFSAAGSIRCNREAPLKRNKIGNSGKFLIKLIFPPLN